MSTSFRWPALALMLYASFGLLDLISLGMGEMWSSAHVVAKSLLMPALMAFVWLSRHQIRRHGLILLALLFSWGGDVLLLNSESLFFILGLSSFLLAHVCYIIWFLQGRSIDIGNFVQQQFPTLTLILVSGIGLVIWLWPDLGDMRIPVTVYALVIATMAVAALSRKEAVSPISFRFVLAGALMFMLSDSLIAISRFGMNQGEFPFASIWIMLTYIIAQGLIIYGSTKESSVSSPHLREISDLLQ